MNGNVFKSVYDKLFSVNKDLTEESIFDLETDLGCNVIHLSLKYMNRTGFEKIKEIQEFMVHTYNVRKYTTEELMYMTLVRRNFQLKFQSYMK